MNHEFDAFLSYARAESTDEARALKQGIEKFARPWNRARSSTVFLDDQSLSANSSLDDSITESLARARWLIVLLSEAAAASQWVNREVTWWLDHRDANRLLLVHDRGAVGWEDGDFTTDSTAIPPALRGRLEREPRWIDLQWFDAEDSLREQDPRFAEVVLQLYCPLHDLDREAAVAQQDGRVRHAKRLARGAIATLSVLLLVAVATGTLAMAKQGEAEAAARQASAQAHAAQAVLELPYSGSAAITAAVRASLEHDDAAVRASMLTVADQTGRLKLALQYPTKGLVGEVRGLSYSPDGEFLHAWGDVEGGGSRLLTWSASTGEEVEDVTISEGGISSLLDAGGHQYVACIPWGPILINRDTLAITRLSMSGDTFEGGSSNSQCSTRYFAGGSLAQGYGDDQYPNVYAILDNGRRIDVPKAFAGTGPSTQEAVPVRLSWNAYVEDGVAEEDRPRGFFFLTRQGLRRVPFAVPASNESGIVNLSPSGQAVVRGGKADFYGYDAVKGGQVTALSTPAGTVHVAPLPDSGDYAWITNGGRVGLISGGQTIELTDVHPADGDRRPVDVYRPQIVPYRDGLLATMGDTVWRLTPPAAGAKWKAKPLSGSLPMPNGESYAWDDPAEAGVCAAGTSLLSIDRVYVDGDQLTAAAGSAGLVECRAVDSGPPFVVDGQEVTATTTGDFVWSEQKHFALTSTGKLALLQVGGRIEVLSNSADSVWSRTSFAATAAADGGQLARFEDGAVVFVSADGEERLELPGNVVGLAVRPDAKAVVVYVPVANELQLVEVGHEAIPLAPECLDALRNQPLGRVEFRPGPDYASAEGDLRAMRPIVQGSLKAVDCLSGRPDTSLDWINQRRYGVTDSGEIRLVWTPPDIGTGTKVRLTQLAPGGQLRTRELPGAVAPVRFGVTGTPEYGFDASGDVVVETFPERVTAELYAWREEQWIMLNRFAGTQGAVEFGALTSDASLVVLVTAAGGFDVFDASSGRRLTGGPSFLSNTIAVDVATMWRNGVLWLHITDREGRLTRIEIPVGAANLRSLLCRRASVTGC